jgi:hypothetical protein
MRGGDNLCRRNCYSFRLVVFQQRPLYTSALIERTLHPIRAFVGLESSCRHGCHVLPRLVEGGSRRALGVVISLRLFDYHVPSVCQNLSLGQSYLLMFHLMKGCS